MADSNNPPVEAELQNGEENAKAQEITKRSLRVQTWKRFNEQKCAAPPLDVFNKIPNFKGAEEAAALLAELDEFKRAKHIKVNIDRAQEPVKLEVIKAGKTLYVPPSKDAPIPSLFTRVKCPPEAPAPTEGSGAADEFDLAAQKKYVRLQGPPESKEEVGIDAGVKLDILVVGTCAVSKQGHRIGKGNGYVDLDFGTLVHIGVITKETLVVTTVHDCQVYDELPLELFQKYDLPIDIIVTPTQVIRIPNRLPRPTGIEWSLLSQRRINLIPALGAIKEKEEKSGKVIVLKEEDTDVESTRKQRSQRQNKRQVRRRRKTRRSETETAGESGNENEEGGRRPNRRRSRQHRRSENGDVDGDASDRKEKRDKKRKRSRNRRENRDLCIKVSNIGKNVRIKELKTELREHGCNPTFISWKGNFGKCYLHFAKKRDVDEEKATSDILASLANLSLNVKCEVVKRDAKTGTDGEQSAAENRIETTDVTAV